MFSCFSCSGIDLEGIDFNSIDPSARPKEKKEKVVIPRLPLSRIVPTTTPSLDDRVATAIKEVRYRRGVVTLSFNPTKETIAVKYKLLRTASIFEPLQAPDPLPLKLVNEWIHRFFRLEDKTVRTLNPKEVQELVDVGATFYRSDKLDLVPLAFDPIEKNFFPEVGDSFPYYNSEGTVWVEMKGLFELVLFY